MTYRWYSDVCMQPMCGMYYIIVLHLYTLVINSTMTYRWYSDVCMEPMCGMYYIIVLHLYTLVINSTMTYRWYSDVCMQPMCGMYYIIVLHLYTLVMQTHIYTLPSAATMTKTKIILINKLFNQFLLFANITTVSTPTLECVYLRIYIEYFVNNSSMSVVLVN